MNCVECIEMKVRRSGTSIRCSEGRLNETYPMSRIKTSVPEVMMMIAESCSFYESMDCKDCSEWCRYFKTCGYKDKPIRREG